MGVCMKEKCLLCEVNFGDLPSCISGSTKKGDKHDSPLPWPNTGDTWPLGLNDPLALCGFPPSLEGFWVSFLPLSAITSLMTRGSVSVQEVINSQFRSISGLPRPLQLNEFYTLDSTKYSALNLLSFYLSRFSIFQSPLPLLSSISDDIIKMHISALEPCPPCFIRTLYPLFH